MFFRIHNSCSSPCCRFTWCQLNLLLVVALVLQSGLAQYESPAELHRSRLGVVYGHGAKEMPWSNLDITYDYEVNLLQFQYFYAIKTGRNFDFDVLIAPQYNTTTYRKVDEVGDIYNGYEVGLTAGISPRLCTSNRALGFYLLLTSGPMYISGTPSRQAEGFNFASMAATGVQLRLLKKAYIDLRTGFRHLSNARLKEPNGGVNNLVWSVGLNYGL